MQIDPPPPPLAFQGRIQDSQRKGVPTYYLAKFCRKLDENEQNWTRGVTYPKVYYVDPHSVHSMNNAYRRSLKDTILEKREPFARLLSAICRI